MITATKKYLGVGKSIVQAFFFLRTLTKNTGEPVNWSSDQVQAFFNSMGENHMMANRFAIAIDIKLNRPFFTMNTKKYLDYNGELTVEKYFNNIHIDYLEAYIKWSLSVYLHVKNKKDTLAPMEQCSRIALPMKLKKTGYHWVLSEAFLLQMDKENNMVSHLNIFTPLRPFDHREKIPLVGDFWNKHVRDEEWTQEIWKKYYTSQTFVLSPEQRRIVDVLLQDSSLTNAQIAERLGKQKNNIDVQNKQILARARECFTLHTFETVRDVVDVLAELSFFTNEYSKETDGHGNQIGGVW